MKKILFIIFVALISTISYAQSSVTVYGLLDVGYLGNTYRGTGTSATTNQTTNSFGTSSEQPSNLGVKGTEDLGSGMSAFFTVETGLQPTSATASTLNNRQSFVGIKQNGIGAFAVGTQYTPIFNALAMTDPGKLNDTVGSIIAPSVPQSYGNTGATPYGIASSTTGTSDAYTVRTSNTLTYKSENVYGFTVNGMYTLNNQNQTQSSSTVGGTNTYSGFGFGVNYEYQKLLVSVAYQSLKSIVPGSLTSPTPALWTTASGGVNTQDTQMYVAGVYDFGILKGYAGWINRKATDTINSNYYASRSAQQIGVRGYWTPTIESWASIGNGSINTWGADSSITNARVTGYQLGTNYWLSKRTNLYGIFGHTQTNTINVSATGYAAGVRHTF